MKNFLIIPNSIFKVSNANLLKLQDITPHLKLLYTEAGNITKEIIKDSEIILGCPPPHMLSIASNLKWLHVPFAGVEQYVDLQLYANRDIYLTNSSGIFGIPIAEHVIGLMLALSRQFPFYVRNHQQKNWIRRDDVREIYKSTVLILGLGDLGMSIAERLRSFDCKMFAIKRDLLNQPECIDQVFPIRKLNEVLPKADYVIGCLPQTIETIGLMDQSAFDSMKLGSIFINVGRGSLVVESALENALSSGSLMGAGIDVCDPEPLSQNSPLWEFENCIITSHSSAASPYTNDRCYALFSDLLVRFLSKKKMYNLVSFFKGY